MGVVFLAHDATLHRQVALKLLESPPDDVTARTRLLREARSAAALNHPSICTVYEVAESDGCAFIAMEYVDGRPLSDRLSEAPLPVHEALRYGIEAADALAYAHDHGVVHRDLKAANAIVTTTGRLKLVDFGLARREDALLADATTMASVAPTGVAVGTPYAMAPEQVRGSALDARIDIWALGVLLHEMVSGTKPFTAATTPELFSAILRDAPAPLPDAIPRALRSVIERCLEKEPERRYQSAHEVRRALEAILGGTIRPWANWRTPLRRHPQIAAAIAALAFVAVLVGTNAGGVRERLRGSPQTVDPIKLAVLPFENLTGDPEQEYFSDGLTEEMIAELGGLNPERLSVVARTSSMRYKHSDKSLDQIGRELAAGYVLEGSARREGERVRVTATLVRTHDQTRQWSQSFDREAAGILTLQSDVARGVATALAVRLLPGSQTRLDRERRVNPEAFEAYLKGAQSTYGMTRQSLETALGYFESARLKDPQYAPAYAGIAVTWVSRVAGGFVAPMEGTPTAKAAALKALELDDSLPIVHHALADVAMLEWNWQLAEQEYQKAIELNPSFPDSASLYGMLLVLLGRYDEGLAQGRRAIELDPLNGFYPIMYASGLHLARRYDDAIVNVRAGLRSLPDLPMAHCFLWFTLHAKGSSGREALTEAKGCFAQYDSEVQAALDRGYAEGGYRRGIIRATETITSQGIYASPVDIATFYLMAGDNERALEWLSRAVDIRDPNVGFVRDPNFDPLRGDLRFQALVRRIGLPN
jgi:serine/threonine protein kinase/tetratricopeptide (TPR) repeat protein